MNRKTTACFSGYRPEKFPFPLNLESPCFSILQERIETAIQSALQEGYTTFLCGMAAGFDLVCADVFLDVRESSPDYSHLQLVAVVPHQGHTVPPDWRKLYRIIVARCNQVEILLPAYQPNSFHNRNDWMIEHASRLIYYWDGKPGGTAYTVRQAEQQGLDIINIATVEGDGI